MPNRLLLLLATAAATLWDVPGDAPANDAFVPIPALDVLRRCSDVADAPLEPVPTRPGRPSPDSVFVMLNGANRGKWLRAAPRCHGTLAAAAARHLGAAGADEGRGAALHTVTGYSVANDASALPALLHVLMDQEVWSGATTSQRRPSNRGFCSCVTC